MPYFRGLPGALADRRGAGRGAARRMCSRPGPGSATTRAPAISMPAPGWSPAIMAGASRTPRTGSRALPGIGAYTAAAIAAIAFGARGRRGRRQCRAGDRPALRRSTRRCPRRSRRSAALVGALTPAGAAGDFAQAMMDLGATICTPRRPACALCPWIVHCAGRASRRRRRRLPREGGRRRRPAAPRGVPSWLSAAGRRRAARERPDKGLLGGMTEMPSSRWSERARAGDALARRRSRRLASGCPARSSTASPISSWC